MKKLLVIVATAMFSLTTFSQTNKGTVLIDGQSSFDLSFLNTEDEGYFQPQKTSSTTLSLSPSVGYFVSNNFVMGLSIQLRSTKIEDYTVSTIGAGPFARYYFGSSNINPFIQGEFGISSSTAKLGTQSSKSSGFGYGIGGGVAFILTENVALNAVLEYGGTTEKDPDDSRSKTTIAGIYLGLGFSVHL